jgi:dihydroxy-acid dehydratase
VGLVIGHVAPEALLGGPIALVEDGDTITVNVNKDTLDCTELSDPAVYAARLGAWEADVASNGGIHPEAGELTHRVLKRMRATAQPALKGGGMLTE